MNTPDLLVVGAGISGLSLAHFSARAGMNVLVLEQGSRTGGCFHSHRFDNSDFWLELGAHTCYNSYGNLITAMENCRILDRLQKLEKVRYKFSIGNTIRSFPSQINFLELILSLPKMMTAKKAEQTVEQYYAGIVGKRNFSQAIGPVFNAVLCERANDFPADIVFKKRPRRKDILKSFTLTGGLQTITDALASGTTLQVLTGKDVRSLGETNNRYTVSTSDGLSYEAPSVALATQADVAAKLTEAAFPDLSALLSRIPVHRIESVGVIVKRETTSLPPVAGLVAPDDDFYSVVSRDTVPNTTYRGFTFHFKPGRLDLSRKLQRISAVLGLKTEPEQVMTKENATPSLMLSHTEWLRRVDGMLSGKRILLTGNYFSGLAIEDCVSRSLSEFERLKVLLR